MSNNLNKELSQLKDISLKLDIDITEYIKEIDLIIQEESNLYFIEEKLDDLSRYIRRKWITENNNHTSHFLKSPEMLITPTTLLNTKYDFTYERNLDTNTLERKIEKNNQKSKWNNTSLAFSSGMAAINSLLNSLLSFYAPSENNPLRMICFADYFESRGLIDVISRSFLDIEYTNSNEIDINSYDIIYIEPTKYDWNLSSIDIDRMCSFSMETDNEKYKFIIIDSTLSRNSDSLDKLLDHFNKYPFLIVFEITSGLKLHQFGLEFCNFGYLNIYCRNDDNYIIDSQKIKEYIKRIRTLMGSALSFEAVSLLDNPLIFNEHMTKEYIDTIFENNMNLRNNIKLGGLFKEVSFAEQGSPFVVFQMKNNNLAEYGYLMGIISEEVKKVGASIFMGSSFGFRHHRYETIIPNNKISKGLFKIAMGYRRGPSYNFILSLMKEISELNNFNELELKYPNINPVKFDTLH